MSLSRSSIDASSFSRPDGFLLVDFINLTLDIQGRTWRTRFAFAALGRDNIYWIVSLGRCSISKQSFVSHASGEVPAGNAELSRFCILQFPPLNSQTPLDLPRNVTCLPPLSSAGDKYKIKSGANTSRIGVCQKQDYTPSFAFGPTPERQTPRPGTQRFTLCSR